MKFPYFISSGSYGDVYTNKEGTIVKKVQISKKKSPQCIEGSRISILNEISIYKLLQKDTHVCNHDMIQYGQYYFIMKHKGICLADCKGNIHNKKEMIKMLIDEYIRLYNKGIIVCDIKCENVVVELDLISGRVICNSVSFIDYGFSRFLYHDSITCGIFSRDVYTEGHNTPYFIYINTESDLYALGVLLLDVLSEENIYTRNKSDDYLLISKIGDLELRDLVKTLMSKNRCSIWDLALCDMVNEDIKILKSEEIMVNYEINIDADIMIMQDGDINYYMRAVILQSMAGACLKYGISLLCYDIAIVYFDIFISKQKINITDLFTLGMVCLYLASRNDKFVNIYDCIYYMSLDSYSEDDFNNMLNRVLKALDYNLHYMTPMKYITIMEKNNPDINKILKLYLKMSIGYLDGHIPLKGFNYTQYYQYRCDIICRSINIAGIEKILFKDIKFANTTVKSEYLLYYKRHGRVIDKIFADHCL